MATAYKLVYGPWTSSLRVYTDYGATDRRDDRALNYNSNLVCEPGTEIVTNDFSTVTYGTAPPVDELYGFEADVNPDYLCERATRRPLQRHVGQRPSLLELGMHLVTLDYDPDFDLEAGFDGTRVRVRLLRADVVDELSYADAEAITGRSHPYVRPANPHGPYRLGEPHADEFYGLTPWPTASGRWVI